MTVRITILFILLFLSNLAISQKKTKYEIPGFIQINDTLFISRSELTIEEYAIFLVHLRKEDSLAFLKALPSTKPINWVVSNSTKLQEIFEVLDTAISYPTWIKFMPIVNLSKEQATYYCEQFTFAYNAYTVIAPKKIKKRRPLNVLFRLPTLKEWTYVASGGYDTTSSYLGIKSTQKRNINPISKEYLNNFPGERQPFFSEGGWNFGVKNKFGVFNMPGNVWEIIADKDLVVGGSFDDSLSLCTFNSSKPYSGPSDNVGFRIVAIVKNSETPALDRAL